MREERSTRIRSNLATRWEKADFGATWNMRYYSSQTENCQVFEDYGYGFLCTDTDRVVAVPTDANLNGVWDGVAGGDTFTQRNAAERHIGAATFHDVSAYWNAPWNATIAVGVNNVFDKAPGFGDHVRQLVRPAVRFAGPVLLLPLLAEVLIDPSQATSATALQRAVVFCSSRDGHL